MRPESEPLGGLLERASRLLLDAEHILATRPPELPELHAGVDGAMRVADALAEFVRAVSRQAPAALAGRREAQVLGELLADLHAVHGCLITGPRLLAPARDDLCRLLTTRQLDGSGGPVMPDDIKPAADVADQQRPALPDDDTGLDELALADQLRQSAALEADPADVAEQHRVIPVTADEE
ncbi:hypothetical protein [Amycolatopsis anabasis]|uniref:hypothetical protein n=1 Tax=Amycolatopsis anabasis TaxID=1840409 RepID=UPI00131C10D6|nr:hypothetical protein [Amycolatopsis anabasis]